MASGARSQVPGSHKMSPKQVCVRVYVIVRTQRTDMHKWQAECLRKSKFLSKTLLLNTGIYQELRGFWTKIWTFANTLVRTLNPPQDRNIRIHLTTNEEDQLDIIESHCIEGNSLPCKV